MKRAIRLACFASLGALSIASCVSKTGKEDSGGETPVDPNKTQVYVGNYYGGLGDAWLRTLAEEYMAEHDDVQIHIDNDKARYLPDQLLNAIGTYRQNLFFVDNCYYYDLATQGHLADITDVVTTPLTEYGETRSIADKLPEALTSFFANNSITNGRYYALPSYQSHNGWVYDVDLFESKDFYFASDSTAGNYKFTGKGAKSVGPDGVTGTYDDGLPVTFDDFYALMDRMVSMNVTPFIWTGSYIDYTTRALRSIWANYEGADNYSLNNTFSGSELLYGDSTPTVIEEKNAYELQRQTGKLKALQFARKVCDNSFNYTQSSTGTSSSHLAAQKEFLNSTPMNRPIAMICEGDWWENEARGSGAFDTTVSRFGSQYAYGTRRFAFMSDPTDSEGKQGEHTMVSTSSNGAFFVNAKNSEKTMKAAKGFLRYCHTDHALALFTTYTGVVRPYDYQLSAEEESKLTPFSRSTYALYRDSRSRMVYDLSACATRNNNTQYFRDYWMFTSIAGSQTYEHPFKAFLNNKSLTAEAYFQGMKEYHKANWSRFGF